MDSASHQVREGWSIREDRTEGRSLAHDGTLFALANGLLGVRGGIEELDRDGGTILATAYVQLPIRYHERFPGFADSTDTRLLGPDITSIRLLIDGAPVDFAAATAIHNRRLLNLRSATIERSTLWKLADGREMNLSVVRSVPMIGAPICMTRLAVELIGFSGAVTVEFPIEMAGTADGDSAAANDPRISATARLVARGRQGSADHFAVRFMPSGHEAPTVWVAQRIHGGDAGAPICDHMAITARVGPGEPLIATRVVAVACSDAADAGAPVADLDLVGARGPDWVSAAHERAVADWWHDAGIAIDGDGPLETAIRYNLLQLFMSASREPDTGVAAKGLTGEGYEGHYFWDTEVFVLPVLTLTQPALARSILSYRIGRLDRARANALALGHRRGALYPWRTIAGAECSAHYPTGAAQYHVNAAVAFALETYVEATGDGSIMDEGGLELLVETARLWLDLGHFSDRRGGHFLIHGVTGPDEYTALVDNDFYTNAMAQRHLRFAAEMVEGAAPELTRQLAQRIGLAPGETADWRRAADHMWLPVDAATGVHPQDDSFLDKPEFPELANPDRVRPLLLAYHPMLLYRHRLAKQGDVIQAHHVARVDASRSQVARDFDYYEPLTTHDSTLSMTAFGVIAARLGRDEQALHFHRETAFVDIEDRHGNSSHGAHMAAMAGSWLILAQGWGGLRLDADTPWLAPRCPAEWTSYRFRFTWRGSHVEVVVDAKGATYRLVDGAALVVHDHGRPVEVGDEPVMLPAPVIEAVIFDLDGVLTDTAEAHYKAWKRMADDEGIAFTREDNEQLKGVDRRGSLARILANAEVEVDAPTFDALMARKNDYYRQLIADYSPSDLFDGVRDLLRRCQRAGLKIGLASASRNAPDLIERLGIARFFDHVTDPSTLAAGKPDPAIFTATAAALGAAPSQCVGIEDAQAGIEAINAAGMTSFGVGDPALLADARRVFASTNTITLSDIHAAG